MSGSLVQRMCAASPSTNRRRIDFAGISLTLGKQERSTPNVFASNGVTARAASKHSLDPLGRARQLTHSFGVDYVKSLQHYRIEGHARKRYSPPRYGQEKGRRGPPRHQERAPHVQPEPARTPHLGAGAEEVCPDSRYRPRDEDAEQERRLCHLEKGWRNFGLVRLARFMRRRCSHGALSPCPSQRLAYAGRHSAAGSEDHAQDDNG